VNKSDKAVYMVSEAERRNETFYCTGAQSCHQYWALRFQHDTNCVSLNFTSRLKCDLKR